MNAKMLPAAFAEHMRNLLGDEEYNAYIESFNEQWKPGLRANTLKISPEALKQLLPWDLEPVPWVPAGFYYEGEQVRPSKHPAYYAGLYYLQEPSAMTPGQLLFVSPGDRVLDLCAAPGGKSTQLGARLLGRGLLAANDVSTSRARALLKNLELAGIPNICVTGETPDKLAEVFPEYFDKILVDAPCSGEGMFRRDPEMVKDWAAKGPEYYAPLQREILSAAVTMLKPGGYILYSTCTFSRCEDEETVIAVLERFSEMELVSLDPEAVPGAVDGIGLHGCLRLFPHKLRGEGHFLALLHKTGGDGKTSALGTMTVPGTMSAPETLPAPGSAKASRRRKGAVEIDLTEFTAFLDRLDFEVPRERLLFRPEGVYLLPEGLEHVPPLRFLRTGLLIGEIKKGRFEPSQALAMALKKEQFPVSVDFSMEDERVIRYLKGETVALSGEEGPVKGWCLVCAGGFPLGWAKGAGMTLKNKYYPGWRWQ